jgi:hypothetical protein
VSLTYLTNASANAAIAAITPASTNVDLSLHISTGPGNTGANEETGTGYSYQVIQFGAASAGVELGPTSTASFTATAWSGTLGYFGVWASGHSTWECGGALTATLTPPSSCTVVVLVSGISISVQG